jgi:catalase
MPRKAKVEESQHDAFPHLKVIGATKAASPLLEKAGVTPGDGVLIGANAAHYVSAAANGKVWSREPAVRTLF